MNVRYPNSSALTFFSKLPGSESQVVYCLFTFKACIRMVLTLDDDVIMCHDAYFDSRRSLQASKVVPKVTDTHHDEVAFQHRNDCPLKVRFELFLNKICIVMQYDGKNSHTTFNSSCHNHCISVELTQCLQSICHGITKHNAQEFHPSCTIFRRCFKSNWRRTRQIRWFYDAR